MREGDLLVIGPSRKEVSLVCEVEAFERGCVLAEVINGRWTLVYFNGRMWTQKYGNAIKGKILYCGPMLPYKDYNDLIYVSEQFLRWGMFKFVYVRYRRTKQFFKRVGKAWTAAKHSWRGTVDDDDIPF